MYLWKARCLRLEALAHEAAEVKAAVGNPDMPSSLHSSLSIIHEEQHDVDRSPTHAHAGERLLRRPSLRLKKYAAGGGRSHTQAYSEACVVGLPWVGFGLGAGGTQHSWSDDEAQLSANL